MPRFTFVSDGNPRRRLLIGSKKWQFVEISVSHGTPPVLVRNVLILLQQTPEMAAGFAQNLIGPQDYGLEIKHVGQFAYYFEAIATPLCAALPPHMLHPVNFGSPVSMQTTLPS